MITNKIRIFAKEEEISLIIKFNSNPALCKVSPCYDNDFPLFIAKLLWMTTTNYLCFSVWDKYWPLSLTWNIISLAVKINDYTFEIYISSVQSVTEIYHIKKKKFIISRRFFPCDWCFNFKKKKKNHCKSIFKWTIYKTKIHHHHPNSQLFKRTSEKGK